jgi:hypothetical protein
MLTWLRIIVSCFCLVLCVLFAASWVRSYICIDLVVTADMRFNQWRTSIFEISSGQLRFQQAAIDGKPSELEMRVILKGQPVVHRWSDAELGKWVGPQSTYLGFAVHSSTDRQSGKRHLQWSVPHWALVFVFGLAAYAAKPRPRFRFGLRELIVLSTVVAITLGTFIIVLRAISK